MAITSNVSNFLNNIKQGVKSNLFLVEFQWPTVVSDGPDNDLANMLCKSAALPASNLGVIEVPFRGRTVKIAGDRTFDTWTVTIINDRDFTIRHGFERWMEAMNTHVGNTADAYIPDQGGTGFLKDLTVKQLERDSTDEGSVLREYKLYGCFPTNVSQIDVAYDSNDQIEDFTVEFQLQYWHATQGGAASGGGSIAK